MRIVVIIEKRRIVPVGGSQSVTIPAGHTILRKGYEAVTVVANNVIIIAPEDMPTSDIKKDLRHVIENL